MSECINDSGLEFGIRTKLAVPIPKQLGTKKNKRKKEGKAFL